eukprot:TRINITY_DN1897_c0_g1_i3.p1 TRINITY_DN1897_c0_g1~~TRINITY_DN1897_c0_g1_i3.p1  ORF type:complete len:133 (+),score=5.40 TRINITY_DN1897_c0_g1_i3:667-1065(+)
MESTVGDMDYIQHMPNKSGIPDEDTAMASFAKNTVTIDCLTHHLIQVVCSWKPPNVHSSCFRYFLQHHSVAWQPSEDAYITAFFTARWLYCAVHTIQFIARNFRVVVVGVGVHKRHRCSVFVVPMKSQSTTA